jgi:hypothetical protein
MENQNEIWKDIPGYEGIYKVSSLGRVKSLKRKVAHYNGGGIRNIKEKILEGSYTNYGYLQVTLRKNNAAKNPQIQILVAMAFLGHTPCGLEKVVDHIDNNKINNRVENLQIIPQRLNASKDRKGGSSKYVGVYWNKRQKKWRASIFFNGKSIHLGYFDDEKLASKAYQEKLKNIKK